LFAVAQKKYTFIYDKKGMEIHKLKHFVDVNRLEFLPYHYLLASIGTGGYLKFQDTSTGQLVSELRTKMGPCDAMKQNAQNAVIGLGHANGVVTMWSPTAQTPLVKMLCHRGTVLSLAYDLSGQ
jgi:U3 small nucleolar RNA-associated protein 7